MTNTLTTPMPAADEKAESILESIDNKNSIDYQNASFSLKKAINRLKLLK